MTYHPSFKAERNADLLVIAGQKKRRHEGRLTALRVFLDRCHLEKRGSHGRPTREQQLEGRALAVELGIYNTCPQCEGWIVAKERGRPATYCSDYCRKDAHAERQRLARPAVAQELMSLAVRLETLASQQHEADKRGTRSLTSGELVRLQNLTVLIHDEAAKINPARLV